MSFAQVGTVWTPTTFAAYLADLNRPTWCQGVCLHHTAEPSLAQRPRGFTVQHILNIQDFYERGRGWRSGPHLFIDDDQIFGMTPLREEGVHAVSFNSTHIGIEVLGNYDSENPKEGRGKACWDVAIAACGDLLNWLNLPVNGTTVRFHRDDPRTSKSCPGLKVHKDAVLESISRYQDRGHDVSPPPHPHGDRLCVPVLKHLTDRGVPVDYVLANLRSQDGCFYFGPGDELEGAYYEPVTATTWAPVSELAKYLPT